MQISSEADYNRQSLRNHLYRGEFSLAEEKIEDNLSQIIINADKLNEYWNKIELKKDKKGFILKGTKLIEETGILFEDTFVLIKDFQSHKFTSKLETLKYLKLCSGYEKRAISYKNKFTELSERIEKVNTDSIEQARSSMSKSKRPTLVSCYPNIRNSENNLQQELIFVNAHEYIPEESIVLDTEKQVEIIQKVMKDLNDLSKEAYTMTIKQNVIIDTIESHIENALTHTENAKDNIIAANEISKRTSSSFFNANKILVFLLVFVGILFFLSLTK